MCACLFCYTDVTSTRSHCESTPPAVPYCTVTPDSMRSAQRIRTQGHIISWAKKVKTKPSKTVRKQNSFKLEKPSLNAGQGLRHPFPAVLNAMLCSPLLFPKTSSLTMKKSQLLSLRLNLTVGGPAVLLGVPPTFHPQEIFVQLSYITHDHLKLNKLFIWKQPVEVSYYLTLTLNYLNFGFQCLSVYLCRMPRTN